MSIGGELFLTCDGEELLQERFRCETLPDGRRLGCMLVLAGDEEVDGAPRDAAATLRERAQASGWVTASGGRDLCPPCATQHAQGVYPDPRPPPPGARRPSPSEVRGGG